MTMKPEEKKHPPVEEFESEFMGWKINSWKWYEIWNVTAEFFDRENLRHGICFGHGATKEDAEKEVQRRIQTGEKVKWTAYTRHESWSITRITGL